MYPVPMEELTSFTCVPETTAKPTTDVNFKKLVNEVMADEMNGATNFDRATAARSALFSRLRFPKSSIGTPIKKP